MPALQRGGKHVAFGEMPGDKKGLLDLFCGPHWRNGLEPRSDNTTAKSDITTTALRQLRQLRQSTTPTAPTASDSTPTAKPSVTMCVRCHTLS